MIDKLGIKPESSVEVIGVTDRGFLSELAARTKHKAAPHNFILFGVEGVEALSGLAALRKKLAPQGAIWVVWPKGQKHIKEDHVREAAIAQGLVDVKVCAFSETHSALKLCVRRG